MFTLAFGVLRGFPLRHRRYYMYYIQSNIRVLNILRLSKGIAGDPDSTGVH